MKKIWEAIKTGLLRFFVSTWYVWLAVIVAVVVALITKNFDAAVYTGFGIVGAFIVYIFLRQIWWFISGTGDYIGRRGLLKRLWELIFGKKDVEDSDS